MATGDISSAVPTGYVYVALQENTGLLKIGTTRHLAGRMRRLRHTHGPVVLLNWIDGGDAEERRLQAVYAEQCVGGEWFDSDRLLEDALDGRLEERMAA